MTQKPVADIIREFAAALDTEACKESLAKIDPLRVKLTALLDAVGKYAAQVGVEIKPTYIPTTNLVELAFGVSRKLTDELRRFADVLQSRHDEVRDIDPGYKRLASVCQAIRIFCGLIGVDLGIGGGFITANQILFPNAHKQLLKGSKVRIR